ncbi:MAG: hypothetical protein GX868_10345 [Actinobacteria bacterium]|nr:hypothetical protein [Actinomycetota bacterium]
MKILARSYDSGLFVVAQTCAIPHDFANGELADLCDGGSSIQALALTDENDRFAKPEVVPAKGDLVDASGGGAAAAISAGGSIWSRSNETGAWKETIADAVDVCFTGTHAFGRPRELVASVATVPQGEAQPAGLAVLKALDLKNPAKWAEIDLPVTPDSISCGPSGAVVAGGPSKSQSIVHVDDLTLAVRTLATVSGTVTSRNQTLGQGGLVLASTFADGEQGGILVDPATGETIPIALAKDFTSSDRLREQALGASYFMTDEGAPIAVGSDRETWTVAEVAS